MIVGFTKKEFLGVTTILSIIIIVTLVNLRVSFMKSRDASRKSDIRSIYDALLVYQYEFGFLPFSEDGKIQACKGELGPDGFYLFKACEWYQDKLTDINDDSYKPYLAVIPGDPLAQRGREYVYFSNGKHFQIYASIENTQDDEYDPRIVARGIMCGNVVCNFGRSDGKTPLDKSLEEYENELLELEK